MKLEPSYYDQVQSKRVPVLAKLGIFTLATSSLLGLVGFVANLGVSRQSVQLLSVSATSAVLAAITTLFAVRRRGLINIVLPEQVERPLLESTVLEVYQEMGRQFDMQAFTDQCMELGPFLLALTPEEQNECVDNMGSDMQHVFRSRGLLSLMPEEVQLAVLPQGVPARVPPVERTPADLTRQQALAMRLVQTRLVEVLAVLQQRYPVVRGAVQVVSGARHFVHFLRIQSGNDTQVAIIMSVFLVFVLRILFVVVSLVLRKFFGVFYL